MTGCYLECEVLLSWGKVENPFLLVLFLSIQGTEGYRTLVSVRQELDPYYH